jgi:hypothetical protein
MKHIKKFNQLFENNSYSNTFDQTQHEEFCQAVLDWVNETGQEIRWSLWANPHKESDEERMARVNTFNDMKARSREKFGTASKYPEIFNRMDDDFASHSEMEKAKRYWDNYVKDGRKATLVEMGDKLVMALIKDGNIEMAFDNMDSKVDPSMIKDLI